MSDDMKNNLYNFIKNAECTFFNNQSPNQFFTIESTEPYKYKENKTEKLIHKFIIKIVVFPTQSNFDSLNTTPITITTYEQFLNEINIHNDIYLQTNYCPLCPAVMYYFTDFDISILKSNHPETKDKLKIYEKFTNFGIVVMEYKYKNQDFIKHEPDHTLLINKIPFIYLRLTLETGFASKIMKFYNVVFDESNNPIILDFGLAKKMPLGKLKEIKYYIIKKKYYTAFRVIASFITNTYISEKSTKLHAQYSNHQITTHYDAFVVKDAIQQPLYINNLNKLIHVSFHFDNQQYINKDMFIILINWMYDIYKKYNANIINYIKSCYFLVYILNNKKDIDLKQFQLMGIIAMYYNSMINGIPHKNDNVTEYNSLTTGAYNINNILNELDNWAILLTINIDTIFNYNVNFNNLNNFTREQLIELLTNPNIYTKPENKNKKGGKTIRRYKRK